MTPRDLHNLHLHVGGGQALIELTGIIEIILANPLQPPRRRIVGVPVQRIGTMATV